ncbi:4-oxalocrotonate tautomerase family protein [Leptospira wolffii]|uniref:4-oxalocrotonate tautomerase n=1 Tax=Leptospira wolffii TaxID=409998 RepID=A0A2M9ZAG6_9LEPT|nr:4-oxalocrotonate tautomerase family protein [Leptospira wolffii]PJZ65342.1 4-oxalocrotonate tautomerase [Leptospira wolffii]TGK64779.1 4-oxalocrotonate tautomerase family protein [Leptospira wolffii]TGK76822.1 4-oxalocrotonate tautomerase family protein [Leptospira wolffii]TGK77326.1 4-oxalocrotonate tautomerase family protein [Leptospira wolffii]TGL26721.1 4-oxalocrotonate tautomerase family protein [Leptospira wolffii]
MPYVNVKVAGPLTKEQKKAIVKEITETLSKVAGRAPDSTYIVIDEVSRENWAKGGDLLE